MAQSSFSPSVRSRARIIALPGAALAPVVQRRGPGRRPANVVNLSRWQMDRQIALTRVAPAVDNSPAANLIDARACMALAERLYHGAREQWLVAQQRAGITKLSLVL